MSNPEEQLRQLKARAEIEKDRSYFIGGFVILVAIVAIIHISFWSVYVIHEALKNW